MIDTGKVLISPEDCANVLRDIGYRGKVLTRNGDPSVESDAHGLTFYVNFLKSDKAQEGEFYSAVQFDAGAYLKTDSNRQILSGLCNVFNNSYRFLKSSVGGSSKKFVNLQLDLTLYGNARDSFGYHAGMYIFGIKNFVEDIIETDAFRGDGCSKLHDEGVGLLWGPDPDPAGAIKLFRKAADLGFAGAQNNLDDQYERGVNLSKSEVFAAYLYARAAERGEPTAYASLACLLAEHAADSFMKIEAAKFALLAIEELPDGINRQICENILEKLKSDLSEEDLASADDGANTWRPLYQEMRVSKDTLEIGDALKLQSKGVH